jgi:hypothetical protein
MRLFRAPLALALALALAGSLATAGGAAPAARPQEVQTVTVDLAAPGVSFVPDRALGAGLDGMGRDEIDALYTPFNVRKMRSAGLRPITYRLRTELGVEAWHWGPEGTWSDSAHSQGYWVSSDHPAKPIMSSYGYDLPRRGDTIDNANNTAFSKLDDGDAATFWKSNPYLDTVYTHEAQAQPQWAVIELGDPQQIDAATITWAAPYATQYRLQYWIGADEYDPKGRWIDFPAGVIADGQGGKVTLRLSSAPVSTEFVRLLMTQGSRTAQTPASTDLRDRLGYAVAEIALGVMKADGTLADVVHHGGRKDQSVIHVSSNDPWHRAIDRDEDLQQPGFDRVYRSGLTNGLPMMVPVPVLFDTPENAAAEIRFLKRRGYPIGQVELGEEADGQYIDAAAYGALFIQGANAVHAVDPTLVTGGPSLQNGEADQWLDADPDRSWTSHWIRYLKDHDGLKDLGFFSFERYPFDDICGDLQPKLLEQTQGMAKLFDRLRRDGVPVTIPWLITEYGFSAYSGRAMVEMPSVLLNADIVGQFLTLGGSGAYLFGYGPNVPINQHLGCAGYGNMMLYEADTRGQARWPMPAYYGARLLTQVWSQPHSGANHIYPTSTGSGNPADAMVTSYAVHRPDGRWSILLVNRDAHQAHRVRAAFRDGAKAAAFAGRVEVDQYSAAQYRWRATSGGGRPQRDLPPVHRVAAASDAVTLPPFSLTVLRGRIDPAR